METFPQSFAVFKCVRKIGPEVRLWTFWCSTCWSGAYLSSILHPCRLLSCQPWGWGVPSMSPCVQAPGGMPGVLLHHSPRNSREAGSSIHALSERVTIEPRQSSCLHSLSTGVTGVHMATPRFCCGDTWDLNSGSDACVLSILPTSHVTRLLAFFIALNSSSHPGTTMLLSL